GARLPDPPHRGRRRPAARSTRVGLGRRGDVHQLVHRAKLRRAVQRRRAQRLARTHRRCVIGPITAATAAEYGLSTEVMPSEYTIPALARALTDYFARAPKSAGRRSRRSE